MRKGETHERATATEGRVARELATLKALEQGEKELSEDTVSLRRNERHGTRDSQRSMQMTRLPGALIFVGLTLTLPLPRAMLIARRCPC